LKQAGQASKHITSRAYGTAKHITTQASNTVQGKPTEQLKNITT
jgi:hypothetical protein